MLNKTEFTEEQLIEAFRICSYESTKKNPCRNCPANESDICTAEKGRYIERRIYQLILKQKAEIERLTGIINSFRQEVITLNNEKLELQKQVDELTEQLKKLKLVHTSLCEECADYCPRVPQAVKDTAKEIYAKAMEKSITAFVNTDDNPRKDRFVFISNLKKIVENKGVEVE